MAITKEVWEGYGWDKGIPHAQDNKPKKKRKSKKIICTCPSKTCPLHPR